MAKRAKKKNQIAPDSPSSNAGAEKVLVSAERGGLKEVPLDEIVSGIVRMVHQVGFDDKCSVRKAKTLPVAFVLRRETIEKIEQYAIERMTPLQTAPSNSVTFEGVVGYADLTVRAFPSLQELLDHAGDRKSPTDLTLRWKALLAKPLLMMTLIEVKFHTDTRKERDSLELLHFPIAHIEYMIGGVDNDWVEGASQDIEPVLRAIRLRGLYKPLLVFRNRAVVNVLSWGLAVLVQILTINVAVRIVRRESKASVLDKIVSAEDIVQKFQHYVEYKLSDTSLMEPLLVMGSGILLMIVTLVACFHLLPQFVPRSGILIGLEKTRFEAYENVFKFLVFTVLFGGLGVAIVVEIVKAIF